MKLPVVAPAATVIVAGTVSALLLSESATDVLAVAAADKVTVQVAVAPEATVAGEHANPETVGKIGVTVVVPPVPKAFTGFPVPETAIVLLIGIDTLEPAPAVRFAVIVATIPSAMPVASVPLAMHVSDAVPDAQLSVLLAAVSAAPAAALIEAMSAVEYESVHCKPAGDAPPVRERLSETAPP